MGLVGLKNILCLSDIFISILIITIINMHTAANGDDNIYATCQMMAHSGVGNVSGVINFTQNVAPGTVFITIQLQGFPVTNGSSKHGFHVHQSGNLSASCNACGPHYNPYNVTHGSQMGDAMSRHQGDLGNVVVQNGAVNTTMSDSIIKLNGDYSILNRSVVVHLLEDDLGKGNATSSNTTGNAGARLGCCTIVLVEPSTNSSSSSSSSLLQTSVVASSASFASAIAVVIMFLKFSSL